MNTYTSPEGGWVELREVNFQWVGACPTGMVSRETTLSGIPPLPMTLAEGPPSGRGAESLQTALWDWLVPNVPRGGSLFLRPVTDRSGESLSIKISHLK